MNNKKIFLYGSMSIWEMPINELNTKEDYFKYFNTGYPYILESEINCFVATIQWIICAMHPTCHRCGNEMPYVFVFDMDGNLENKYCLCNIINGNIEFDAEEYKKLMNDYNQYFDIRRALFDLKLANGNIGNINNCEACEHHLKDIPHHGAGFSLYYDYVLAKDGLPYKISFEKSELIYKALLEYRNNTEEDKKLVIYDLNNLDDYGNGKASKIEYIDIYSKSFKSFEEYPVKCTDYRDIDINVSVWINDDNWDERAELYRALQMLINDGLILNIVDDDSNEALISTLQELKELIY